MEARGATAGVGARRIPAWLYGVAPLVLIAAAIGLFAALGDPGLGDRNGPPVEELAVERTELKPGQIDLTVRNDGPDSVRIAQVIVNDGFTDFTMDDAELGHLESGQVRIGYPWVEGSALQRRPADLDRREDLAHDRRRRGDPRGRRRLLPADGAARLLRGDRAGGAGNAVAAVRAPDRPALGAVS